MIPELDYGSSDSPTYTYRDKNLTYKVNDKNIVGQIDGIASIKQSIRHIIATERFSNPIYDDDYGIELEQYIGKDIGFIKAGIEETLKDALCQDDRIFTIDVLNVKKSVEQKNACVIQFMVSTIYGEFTEEMDVVQ